jgi:CBS domain-containing protein
MSKEAIMTPEKRDHPRLLREVMTREVETISPTATIDEAAQRMKALNVGAIPVCDGSRLRGMITDRDIVLRVVAEKRQAGQVKIQDAMTPEIHYCYEDQNIEEAARLMEGEQVRRLPVVNREKELVGIVSLGDVSVRAMQREMAGKTLEGISQK